ncbi:tyrosine-type recombinase/integrase [Brevibacillus brevis]|uniref:tyrosine-type recombinase/integrase n=1 Tax=Brevibacillus brevis TaxID=1393 RepID=UPI0037CBC53E
MASIEKRGVNSWRLVVEVGYDAQGKRIKRSKTIKVEDEALLRTTKKLRDFLNDELHKFKVEVEAGEYIAPEKMTFGAFVEEWRQKHGEKHLSPTVLDTYNSHLKNHILPVFGHLRIDQIKTIQIVNFFDQLKGKRSENLSGTSRRYVHRVLRDILERAVEWKLIKSTPIEGVKKPEIDTKEKDIFVEDELILMFQKLSDEPLKWRTLIELAVTTGMRRGELLAIDINKHLRWEKIDKEDTLFIDVRESVAKAAGQVIIKDVKTKKSRRSIAVTPEVVPLIQKLTNAVKKNKILLGTSWQGNDRMLLFGQDNGLPTYPDTPLNWFNKFLKRHELNHKNVTLHGLRHSYATYLLFKGYSLKEIQELLGHSNIRITGELYTHFLAEMNKRAAVAFSGLKKGVK